jgi:peptide deformylase
MEKKLENYTLEGELLDIVIFPDPVLTTKATEVTEFNRELEDLCLNMLYTMYKSPGIGLAAPQIGLSKRIFVVDVDYNREETEEDSGVYNLSEFNPRVLSRRLSFTP